LTAETLDCVVVGGGISGLTAATLLGRNGVNVICIEANPSPGGSIVTWKKDNFLFELGPNTVLDNCPEIDGLLSAAGLLDKKINAMPCSGNRYIVKKGKLAALPRGPLSFLFGGTFSMGSKLRLLREPFIPPCPAEAEETVAAFTIRRLGKEFLDYAVAPFVSGVYAGDPYKLSLPHAVPKIAALEKRYGSLVKGAAAKRRGGAPQGSIISFSKGFEVLPETLGSLLGDSFLPSSRVTGISADAEHYSIRVRLRDGCDAFLRTRSAVMAIPAEEASAILSELPGNFPDGISSLPYAPVAVISLGFRKQDVRNPLKGFGFLAPEVENRFVLGCLFSSSLFPSRAPAGHVALTAFAGGAVHPERALMPEEKILDETLTDISTLLGVEGAPVISRVTTWEKAIPQYMLGHNSYKLSAKRFEEENHGIFISGNLLYGVSVGNCIQNATALAGRVMNFLKR